jgi:hypothetical protein
VPVGLKASLLQMRETYPKKYPKGLTSVDKKAGVRRTMTGAEFKGCVCVCFQGRGEHAHPLHPPPPKTESKASLHDDEQWA